MISKMEGKIEAAKLMLPLYNDWHAKCLAEHGGCSSEITIASDLLMAYAFRYRNFGVPQKIEAAVGRWIAKRLKMVWTSQGIKDRSL